MLTARDIAQQLKISERKARNMMNGSMRAYCINVSDSVLHQSLRITEQDFQRWVESQKPANRIPQRPQKNYTVSRKRTA